MYVVGTCINNLFVTSFVDLIRNVDYLLRKLSSLLTPCLDKCHHTSGLVRDELPTSFFLQKKIAHDPSATLFNYSKQLKKLRCSQVHFKFARNHVSVCRSKNTESKCKSRRSTSLISLELRRLSCESEIGLS